MKFRADPSLDLTQFSEMVTVSPQMKSVFETIKKVARTEASILVRGETGTGKELVAAAIHKCSPRRAEAFSALNCATLRGDLLASELFGHVRGAFTGAVENKTGLFQATNQGTMFLDEIAEMPLELQSQLLRVLQDKVVTPVGSIQTQKVDVRLISATHQSLRRLVKEGRFREDLMYRIRVVPLFLPPLRERQGDVEALTWYFVDQFNRIGGRKITRLEYQAYQALIEYPWPGNIRELRNNIEHAFAIGDGPILKFVDLTPELQGLAPPEIKVDEAANSPTVPSRLEEMEKQDILETLRKTRGNRKEAASMLKMSRSTLWRKLKIYQIID